MNLMERELVFLRSLAGGSLKTLEISTIILFQAAFHSLLNAAFLRFSNLTHCSSRIIHRKRRVCESRVTRASISSARKQRPCLEAECGGEG